MTALTGKLGVPQIGIEDDRLPSFMGVPNVFGPFTEGESDGADINRKFPGLFGKRRFPVYRGNRKFPVT